MSGADPPTIAAPPPTMAAGPPPVPASAYAAPGPYAGYAPPPTPVYAPHYPPPAVYWAPPPVAPYPHYPPEPPSTGAAWAAIIGGTILAGIGALFGVAAIASATRDLHEPSDFIAWLIVFAIVCVAPTAGGVFAIRHGVKKVRAASLVR
jgi:hypothetical protein